MLGALVEYGTDFLGPIPNVVIFQFNPETIARTFVIPPRAVDATQRETSQAGEPPTSDLRSTRLSAPPISAIAPTRLGLLLAWGRSWRRCRQWCIRLQTPGGLLGAAVDAIGSLLGAQGPAPTQPIPRQQTPRILFIWGLTRIVPVIIESLSITKSSTMAHSIRWRRKSQSALL